jgi:hypothetical protein
MSTTLTMNSLKRQTAHLLSQMGGCIGRRASWGHHTRG